MSSLTELRETVDEEWEFVKVTRQNTLNVLRWLDARDYLTPFGEKRLRALEAKDPGHG